MDERILHDSMARRCHQLKKTASMKARLLLASIPSVLIGHLCPDEPDKRIRLAALFLSSVCRLSDGDAQRLVCEITILSDAGFNKLSITPWSKDEK